MYICINSNHIQHDLPSTNWNQIIFKHFVIIVFFFAKNKLQALKSLCTHKIVKKNAGALV